MKEYVYQARIARELRMRFVCHLHRVVMPHEWLKVLQWCVCESAVRLLYVCRLTHDWLHRLHSVLRLCERLSTPVRVHLSK